MLAPERVKPDGYRFYLKVRGARAVAFALTTSGFVGYSRRSATRAPSSVCMPLHARATSLFMRRAHIVQESAAKHIALDRR